MSWLNYNFSTHLQNQIKSGYRLDLEKECSRLTQGFAEAVGTSETKKTFHELQELLKPPKWQKSSFWKVRYLFGFVLFHFLLYCVSLFAFLLLFGNVVVFLF